MKTFSTLTLRKFHWTRLLQWISLIALAIAWLLLLLVSITPLKSISFVELATHVSSSHLSVSIGGSVRFGVWGYCYSGLEVSIPKLSHNGTGGCSPRHLGYRIDSSVAKALHVDDLTNAISSSLSFALALHLVDLILVPITAATLFLPERVNRYLDPVWPQNTSLVSFIASSFTFVVVAVTVIIDHVLSGGIKRVAAHGVLQASSGSALRLIEVAAFILLIVWVCAGINMYHRRKTLQSTWRESDLKSFDSDRLFGARDVPSY